MIKGPSQIGLIQRPGDKDPGLSRNIIKSVLIIEGDRRERMGEMAVWEGPGPISVAPFEDRAMEQEPRNAGGFLEAGASRLEQAGTCCIQ